jgi:hypothetical protein
MGGRFKLLHICLVVRFISFMVYMPLGCLSISPVWNAEGPMHAA